jgi:thioredoxin reductase (NADPH)
VVVIHRSQKFRAAKASVDKFFKLCDDYQAQFLQGQVSEVVLDDDQLVAIKVTGQDGVTRRLELDDLLVFFGLVPDLGQLNQWGLALHKRQVVVDTEKFQTSIAGIYAVGDINYYPGKKKLILSGFHEGALAAFAIKEQLQPDKKVHLQYTTTSPIMHKRLQVEDPMKEDDAA